MVSDPSGHLPGVHSDPAGPKALAEAQAFERLYTAHFAFVWRNLRRLGVERSQLDDATQDVFLVVHRRQVDCPVGLERAWMATITLRVAADHRRRAKRKGGLEPLDERLVDGRPRPDDATVQAEQVRRLDRLLGKLPEERREVFVLAELEGLTAPEIAQALSVNVNTVYSRLRLARRDFEAAVEGEGRTR